MWQYITPLNELRMLVPTFQTDRKELKEFFNQFGRAEEVRIKDPGTSKAYANSLF